MTNQEKETIAAMYKSGITMSDIAKKFNRSRERIRQLLAAQGITRIMGGLHLSAIARTKRVQEIAYANRKKRINRTYSCSPEEYDAIMGRSKFYHGCIANRYLSHKYNANKRGIDFTISFPDWYKIWVDSGHMDDRGIGKGKFVMSRFKDLGPYEVGNVEIIPAPKNNSDAWKYKKWDLNHGTSLAGMTEDEKKARAAARFKRIYWANPEKYRQKAREEYRRKAQKTLAE